VLVWTNEYGAGKVFATTMGHNNSTMEDPVFLGCQRHTVLNDALKDVDAIMTLRVQTERGSGVTDAWIAAYQLTPERLQKTKKTPEGLPAWVLHPGPVNWGVELHPQFRFGQSHKHP
jgi:aspartate carbamoyltransferase catalytic subunit